MCGYLPDGVCQCGRKESVWFQRQSPQKPTDRQFRATRPCERGEGPVQVEQPPTSGRPLVVAQTEAPSFAEEQSATQQTSIVGPPERLADSTRQIIGVEEGGLSPP